MDLRRKAFELDFGTMLGLSVLIGTWWLLVIDSQDDFFSKFSTFFFGYSINWAGAFGVLFTDSSSVFF